VKSNGHADPEVCCSTQICPTLLMAPGEKRFPVTAKKSDAFLESRMISVD
jgi:hypothetical protein